MEFLGSNCTINMTVTSNIYACNTDNHRKSYCINMTQNGKLNFNSKGYFYATGMYVAKLKVNSVRDLNVIAGHFVQGGGTVVFNVNDKDNETYTSDGEPGTRNFVYMKDYNRTKAEPIYGPCFYYEKGIKNY